MSTAAHTPNRTPAGSPDGGKFATKPGGAEADAGSLLDSGGHTPPPRPAAVNDAIDRFLAANPRPRVHADSDEFGAWMKRFDTAGLVDYRGEDEEVMRYHLDREYTAAAKVADRTGHTHGSDEWVDALHRGAGEHYATTQMLKESHARLAHRGLTDNEIAGFDGSPAPVKATSDEVRIAALISRARTMNYSDFEAVVNAYEHATAAQVNARSDAKRAALEVADRTGLSREYLYAVRDQVGEDGNFRHPSFRGAVADASMATAMQRFIGKGGYTQAHHDALTSNYYGSPIAAPTSQEN